MRSGRVILKSDEWGRIVTSSEKGEKVEEDDFNLNIKLNSSIKFESNS